MAKKGVHATRNMGAGIAKGFGVGPTGNVSSGGFGGGGGYASNTKSEMRGYYDPGAKASKVSKKSTLGDSMRSSYTHKELAGLKVGMKHSMGTANATNAKSVGKGGSSMGKISAKQS